MKTKLNPMVAGVLLATLVAGFGQPVIITQPQNQTNAVGTTATFTVGATGTTPLAYQWQKYFADWSDLTDRTNATLGLTNVQTSDAGDYRVAVTNVDGATNSAPAHLYVITPPRITPTASLQHTAVFLGKSSTFSVAASGTATLSYQWRRDSASLLGKTNASLTIVTAQPADEGDYSVVVSNLAGAVTSAPARLYVVPPSTELRRGDFTNATGQRLPYFYWVPTNYAPTHSYWLICSLHGSGDDVTTFLSTTATSWPGRLVEASYKQQSTDPGILFFPTRWYSGEDWTPQYLQLISGLLDRLISQFNIDTNRVVIGGGSQGVHGVWDLLAMRPGFFAGAVLLSGWAGNAPPSAIKDVPMWVFCAADDEMVGVSDSRTLLAALRRAGGNPIYTEYNTGGHVGGVAQGICTPAAVDWMLAQWRGLPSTNEPLLCITSPILQPFLPTGTTKLDLGGTAAALGQVVTKVAWENTANARTGNAAGTNAWSATGIPLVANKTNLIVVTATTTSWAPAYGGNTTFNDTLTVVQSPLRATLTWQGSEALLNWSGGAPPYRVQRATDLAAGDWTDILTNATPPVSLSLTGQAGFYRILGE